MLEGKLVQLRAVEEKDLQLQHKWVNDREVMRYMARYLPVPMKELADELEKDRKDSSSVHFAIEDRRKGRLIGFCWFRRIHPANRHADVGIFIGDKRYWEKGFGTDAMRLLVSYGFDTLNLNRIGSAAFSFNPRSIRMHEKVGFKKEGVRKEFAYRDGRYYDMVVFGLLNRNFKRS